MRTSGVLVVIGLTLVLSACTGSGYPAMDRPATADDVLPADFDPMDLSGLDRESARFEATYDGIDYYIVRDDNGGVCMAVAAGESSITACGEGNVSAGVPGVFSAQLVAEPARDADGYIAISDNIRVKPNP